MGQTTEMTRDGSMLYFPDISSGAVRRAVYLIWFVHLGDKEGARSICIVEAFIMCLNRVVGFWWMWLNLMARQQRWIWMTFSCNGLNVAIMQGHLLGVWMKDIKMAAVAVLVQCWIIFGVRLSYHKSKSRLSEVEEPCMLSLSLNTN